MTDFRCIHCGLGVETATAYGEGGTYWTHVDGYEECPPAFINYASPNLP
jgi:hypothetical protein